MNRTRQLQRLAMLSVHTCPLALLGGKKTGGMNVYVRDLSRELGRRGILVDVFTRSQDDCQPRVKHDLGYGARVIHVPAGPEKPIPVAEVEKYLDEFVEGVVGFAAAEDLRYDLIHSHYWLSGLVAERLQQRWRRHAVEDDRVTRWQGDTEDDRVTRWQGDTEDDRVTRWQGDKVTEKDSVTPSPRHPLTPSPPHPVTPSLRLSLVQSFHTLGHMKNRVALSPAERVSRSRLDGETHIMDVADRIIVSTPAEQAQLQWLYGADLRKTVVIPPGVDLELFRPIPKQEARRRVGIPPHHRSILFAGRIEPLKGIDTLLSAMALLQKRCPQVVENVCVAIIGGDPWEDNIDAEMARLQSLRQQLGIHDLVTFLGSKDQAVLPYYYAAAEMVVMPSDYESFGLVALEAMAMGTPVIASEVGGLAFLVRDGETGFHVPARDPVALAQKIMLLLTDNDCQAELGRNASIYARQYDWAIIAERIVDLYRSLL